MATNTYVALDKVTVSGSSTSTVSFTSISQLYTDLVFIVNGSKSGSGSTDIAWQANSDTNSNYSQTSLYGTGSAASSDRGVSATSARNGRLGIDQSTSILNFQNYSNTTTYKTCISRGNTAGYLVIANVGLWRSTSAISSLAFTLADGTNFTSGTTFSLYGIAAANVGAKATGGVITSDSTYWYHNHTFTSSGTFTPSVALTADYLVVAGGGAGGGSYAYDEYGEGGGGAGGLRSTLTATGGGGSLESALSLTAQGYTVTIGAGGTGDSNRGGDGTNSTFSTITATGGGGGGGGAFSANNPFKFPGIGGGNGGSGIVIIKWS